MKTSRQESKPAAIVIGLDSIQGLQAARILAGQGVPVIGIAHDKSHPYCRTRACREVLTADVADEQLVEALTAFGAQLAQKAVLFPCNDLSVLVVSRHRRALAPWYHVMMPQAEVVEMLMDKNHFYAYAQREGLPIPQTYWLRSYADAEEAAAAISYPCILKPALKSSEWQAHVGKKVIKIDSPEQLRSVYEAVAPYTEVAVVQAWVKGSDAEQFVCYCYFDREGAPAATFTSRKLRQWPPEVGIGSLRIEVKNETVRDIAVRLFRDVDYRGMGFVQIKRDVRSKEYFILEPNIGRPGAGTAVAEAGGVAMHYAMYCDAVGWPLPENLEQTYRDAKWIHLVPDLRSALAGFRRGELSLANWWQSWQGPKVYVSFSWRDPWPFWGNVFQLLRRQRPPEKQLDGENVDDARVSVVSEGKRV